MEEFHYSTRRTPGPGSYVPELGCAEFPCRRSSERFFAAVAGGSEAMRVPGGSILSAIDSLERNGVGLQEAQTVGLSREQCAKDAWSRILHCSGAAQGSALSNVAEELIETAVRLLPEYVDGVAKILKFGGSKQQATACEILSIFCDRVRNHDPEALFELQNLTLAHLGRLVEAVDCYLKSVGKERSEERVEGTRAFLIALRDSGVGQHPELLLDRARR